MTRSIYEIGYHSCEDSSYTQWEHEESFSKSQLIDMVAQCIATAINVSKKFNKDDPCFALSVKDNIDRLITSEDFHEAMVVMGFSELEYKEELSFFGWASPSISERSFKSFGNGYDYALHEKIREKLEINLPQSDGYRFRKKAGKNDTTQ